MNRINNKEKWKIILCAMVDRIQRQQWQMQHHRIKVSLEICWANVLCVWLCVRVKVSRPHSMWYVLRSEKKLYNKNMNCLLIFIFQLRRKLTFSLSLSRHRTLGLRFFYPVQMQGAAMAITATVAATIIIMPRLPLIWLWYRIWIG